MAKQGGDPIIRNTDGTLGEILKSARLEKGMSREKFSKLVGLSSRYIASIENEGRKPSYDRLFILIRALSIRADDIFYPECMQEDMPGQRLSHMLRQCNERDIKVVTALIETLLSESE